MRDHSPETAAGVEFAAPPLKPTHPYTITDLGALADPGPRVSLAFNDAGMVVGCQPHT